jgi:hypothetical protein
MDALREAGASLVESIDEGRVPQVTPVNIANIIKMCVYVHTHTHTHTHTHNLTHAHTHT